MEVVNMERVTIQDCLDKFNLKGEVTILEDGKVTGFKKENAPAGTGTSN